MSYNYSLYGSISKNANLSDYLSAASNGANIGTDNHSWLLNPIDATKGAVKGVLGQVAKQETAGLHNQGVRFNKDPYGRIKDVNIGDTLKNYANNALSTASNFIGEHKGALLGGLGVLGGGYLLHKLLADDVPKPTHQMPGYGTQPIMVSSMTPQAFEKAGNFKGLIPSLPSPIQAPTTAAELITGNLNIPGLSGETKDQSLASPKPHEMNVQTLDPKLKKSLKDPRMRQYLTSLIQQLDTTHQYQ